MYPAFRGKIDNGELVLEELGANPRLLEGRTVAIALFKQDKDGKVGPGALLMGKWEGHRLLADDGTHVTLVSHNGCGAVAVVLHHLMSRVTAEVFANRFQLAGKSGDVDAADVDAGDLDSPQSFRGDVDD